MYQQFTSIFTPRLLIPLTLLFQIGCSNEERLWEEVSEADTIERYEEFIEEFKNSEHTAIARKRIEDLYFEQANSDSSIDAYIRFLEKYPSGEYSNQARRHVDSLSFQESVRINTVEGYEVYLRNYPNGAHVSEANSSLRALRLANNIKPSKHGPVPIVMVESSPPEGSSLKEGDRIRIDIYVLALLENKSECGILFIREDFETLYEPIGSIGGGTIWSGPSFPINDSQPIYQFCKGGHTLDLELLLVGDVDNEQEDVWKNNVITRHKIPSHYRCEF